MTSPAPWMWVEEGVLSGYCPSCGLYLEQDAGADDALARQGFDLCHPRLTGAAHTARLPTGWSRPLSGPGALSQ